MILFGRPERKRPLARPRHSWEDTFKVFKKWNGEAWTGWICLRIGTGGGIL
jgi:hypothetical protein